MGGKIDSGWSSKAHTNSLTHSLSRTHTQVHTHAHTLAFSPATPKKHKVGARELAAIPNNVPKGVRQDSGRDSAGTMAGQQLGQKVATAGLYTTPPLCFENNVCPARAANEWPAVILPHGEADSGPVLAAQFDYRMNALVSRNEVTKGENERDSIGRGAC